ncbi:MAG: serine protein kinase PrkA [Thermodesulfobacteriota bacterium]
MRDLTKAMESLCRKEGGIEQQPILSFADFLRELIEQPSLVMRNVYQVYHDMIKAYVEEGVDEYPDDPESIAYLNYDSSKLFVEGSDSPFFADRLFANRLMRHMDSLKVGAQQNKIYIFDGPHGSGKSTFLNNLLRKFEEYANTEAGRRYEVVWRFSRESGLVWGHTLAPLAEKLALLLEKDEGNGGPGEQPIVPVFNGEYFDVPCPSHDNPILLIPKPLRRRFFDDIFENDKFKWKLYTDKQYQWVFRENPCTVCTSLYQSLLGKLKDPEKVFETIFARPYVINRRLGEGISVFNPGDQPLRQSVVRNEMIQRGLDSLFHDSNQVTYIYSRYAKTNNGIYALMDIKSHNSERLFELHNIISDGVHKVEDMEENVNSLLFGLMNPEDKKQLKDTRSFSDRIEYINIPYVMDLKTEVAIYREAFGKHIDESFLPRVLHNFARCIIATRLMTRSAAMEEWIPKSDKYELYCDRHLQLLKMEIYTGNIPKWLGEEELDRFTAKRRRAIINESEKDGWKGLSGRDAIRMFNEFYSHYAVEDKLINMSMLGNFFRVYCKIDRNILPEGFLDSLVRMYNYGVLNEVKEALYYYNEEQISREIQNYMFAVNFEPDTAETCGYTGDVLTIDEPFFERLEEKLLSDVSLAQSFRVSVQKEYASVTLTQEILRDGLEITETSLYHDLHDRYVFNLKEKVLEPFLKNENFRRAVKDFDEEAFKTYDARIRNDVRFMIRNLQKKFNYTRKGAREICIYVIDNNLAKVFSN